MQILCLVYVAASVRMSVNHAAECGSFFRDVNLCKSHWDKFIFKIYINAYICINIQKKM